MNLHAHYPGKKKIRQAVFTHTITAILRRCGAADGGGIGNAWNPVYR